MCTEEVGMYMYYCLLYRELFPSGLSVLLSSSAAVMIPTISVCCASSYVENCFLISICRLYHDFWLSRVTWKIPFSVLQLVVWHYTTRKKNLVTHFLGLFFIRVEKKNHADITKKVEKALKEEELRNCWKCKECSKLLSIQKYKRLWRGT